MRKHNNNNTQTKDERKKIEEKKITKNNILYFEILLLMYFVWCVVFHKIIITCCCQQCLLQLLDDQMLVFYAFRFPLLTASWSLFSLSIFSVNEPNPKNIYVHSSSIPNYAKQNNLLIATIPISRVKFLWPRPTHPRITADVIGSVAARGFFFWQNEIHGYPRTLKTNTM